MFNFKKFRRVKNFFVIIVIFSLIGGWFFSGWPRIWESPSIPPEIQETQAEAERQTPDSLLQQDNLSGAVTDIDEDPDSPDTNWLTYTSNNVNTVTRVSFSTPTGNPTIGADLQEFKIWVRQQPDGAGADPSVRIELYENNVSLATILADTAVSSVTGALYSGTWNANLLSNADGSQVEAYIYGDAIGGAQGNRCTIEIGAVEWNVDYTAGTVSCSTAPAQTGFETLTFAAVHTATSTATTTMTCTYSGGCTLSVKDAGQGAGQPGLYSSGAGDLIDSSQAELSPGTEGYGIQAATTTAGTGEALLVAAAYKYTGNNVGALSTDAQTLTSASGTFDSKETVVTFKAAISSLNKTGNYVDTVTFECLGN